MLLTLAVSVSIYLCLCGHDNSQNNGSGNLKFVRAKIGRKFLQSKFCSILQYNYRQVLTTQVLKMLAPFHIQNTNHNYEYHQPLAIL